MMVRFPVPGLCTLLVSLTLLTSVRAHQRGPEIQEESRAESRNQRELGRPRATANVDAARNLYETAEKEFQSGRGTVDALYELSVNVCALESRDDSAAASRIAALEGHFRRAKSILERIRDLAAQGRVSLSEASSISKLTLDAETRFAGAIFREAKQQPQEVSPNEVEKAWNGLTDRDDIQGYRAMAKLVAASPLSVPFFESRLRPVEADHERISHLIADLDSSLFPIRQRATEELQNLGRLAESHLRTSLDRGASPEVRRRIEILLARVGEQTQSPAHLRQLRVIIVLEQLNNPAAIDLLNVLARGAPQAPLTHEAQSALERLIKPPLTLP